jgi:hypothetical protein
MIIINDFLKLTFGPVERVKEFRRAFMTKSCLPHPPRIVNVSSASVRWGNLRNTEGELAN